MDFKQALDRIPSLWDGKAPKGDALTELGRLYMGAYGMGQDVVSDDIFLYGKSKAYNDLKDRWDECPKISDPVFLKKLSENEEEAMGQLLWAGEAGATDLSFEVYEKYFMDSDSFTSEEVADTVKVLVEEGVGDEGEVEDEVMYVARSAFGDGVENAIYEAATDEVQKWAEEDLKESAEAATEMSPQQKVDKCLMEWDRKGNPTSFKAINVIEEKYHLDDAESKSFECKIGEKLNQFSEKLGPCSTAAAPDLDKIYEEIHSDFLAKVGKIEEYLQSVKNRTTKKNIDDMIGNLSDNLQKFANEIKSL